MFEFVVLPNFYFVGDDKKKVENRKETTKPTIIVSVLSGVIEIKTKGDFSKQIRIWKKNLLKIKPKTKRNHLHESEFYLLSA